MSILDQLESDRQLREEQLSEKPIPHYSCMSQFRPLTGATCLASAHLQHGSNRSINEGDAYKPSA